MDHMFFVASIKHHMEYSCGLAPARNRQAKPKSLNLEIQKTVTRMASATVPSRGSLKQPIHSLEPDYGLWMWVHKWIMTMTPQGHREQVYPTQ